MLVVTLGTGIGTCLVVDGALVPNLELGHLEIDGHDAESRAADSAREREGLSWEQWAARLQRYFRMVEDLLWPDLIVVGGGVSKKHEQFLPLLDLRTPIVPAALRNDAGDRRRGRPGPPREPLVTPTARPETSRSSSSTERGNTLG